jgi:hypothetical protein
LQKAALNHDKEIQFLLGLTGHHSNSISSASYERRKKATNLCQHFAKGFTIDFSVIDNAYVNISERGFAIDFGIIDNAFANIFATGFTIDFAFANILVRGFTINFGIINNTCANILTRGAAIDFNIFNNACANISARGFAINFGVIDNAFANNLKGVFPSTTVLSTMPSLTFHRGA